MNNIRFSDFQLNKLRAVKLREYLPKTVLAALKGMPYDNRRLKMRHFRAILAGLV